MTSKFLAALALTASLANADRILVNNDEWTFSNTGFSSAAGTDEFAVNVANWLTAGTGGNNILILSQNFGLTGGNLSATLAGAGYNVTLNTTGASSVANLASYDAVYLAGNAVNNTDLVNYVNNGGNVYLAGGTGWGGAAQEAANWNPFLNSFGLGFGSFYNGACCTLTPPNTHEVFDGVSSVYFNNGNNTLDLVAGGDAQIIWSQGNTGLIAAYDGNTAAVPEPGTMALMALGLGAIAFGYRRRKN